MKKLKKKITVAVSGGFDPIHPGHVRMFNEAKKLGDKLVVIINNDNWLKAKKGFAFMPQRERKEIIEGLRAVDKVVFTSHPKNPKDMSVAKELLKLRPDIFAQGGDRKKNNIPSSEVLAMIKLGGKVANNIGRGGKIQSSSWLLKKYADFAKKKRK